MIKWTPEEMVEKRLVPVGRIIRTDLNTLRAWAILLDPTMVKIQFPNMESHWHYKWRMFKGWVKELPSRIRYKVFPYYIVRIEDYEDYE